MDTPWSVTGGRVALPASGGCNEVDNADAGFTASANWGVSSYSGQRFGADYRFRSPVSASDAAWYRFAVPQTGTYRVDAWWPTSTGNQTANVDQRYNGGAWRTLGTFTLTAGDENKVAGVPLDQRHRPGDRECGTADKGVKANRAATDAPWRPALG